MDNDNIEKIYEVLSQKNIKIGDITCALDKKIHVGRNKLSNIKWFNYKFDKVLNELYSSVNLMFFQVDEEALEASAKFISNENTKVSYLEIPHIDGKTGNIHPGKEFVDNFGHQKIEQIVLVNTSKSDPGPKTDEIEKDSEVYSYLPIHKSCYFPRIDGKAVQNDFRYEFLKEVCKKIYEYNQKYNESQNTENRINILGDGILKAIGKYKEEE